MKREDVKTKHGEGMHFDTHVIANPANTHEWIILFKRMPGEAIFWSMTTRKWSHLDASMI